MPPPADTTPPPVLPPRVLLALLAACVGGSWYMVPRRGELIERLFKDKQYERVVAVLQDDVHGMKMGEMSGLRHLDAAQLTALSRLLNLTPREQLHAIFTAKNPPQYDAYIHNIVLSVVRYVDVLPPQEAYDIIAPACHRVPEEFRISLLLTLAHNGISIGRPDLAADCLGLASRCVAASWDIAREMVQYHRWSGRPGLAARQLRAWLVLHRTGLPADQREEAQELSITLALEDGKPGDAFDLCLLELKDSAKGSLSPRLMNAALAIAPQANRTREMLPWLGRALQELPLAKLSLKDLRERFSADPHAFDNSIAWAALYARWSDWDNQFDKAFDYHLRLAVLGSPVSRDRCIELYDHLGRVEECCEMMLTLGDVAGHPELSLLLARQLAELGRDDEAKVRFDAWIKTHPEDRQAQFDFAALLEDMGDEAASRKALTQMVAAFPNDAPAIKRLANACIRDADYASALALYERLPTTEHDHESLENYAMVAESLDAYAAELRALELKAATQPSVEVYLDLAETASYLGDSQKSLEVLQNGLSHLPDSAQLRIALANQHLHDEEPDEALKVLTQSSLRDNEDAVQMLLGMSETLSDARQALAFLGPDLEKRFALTDENRLQLAILNYRGGQPNQAERLFSAVRESPDTLQALAEARFQVGNYEESARLMKAHLQSHPRSNSDDWLFLGDVYEQLGLMDEARKAYDYSLALLTADLPDTAINQQGGAQ
jgi:predicted Zn-dependent protease